MGSPLHDPNLLDGVTARLARLSFSIIHGKCCLCLAWRTIRLAIPADAGAFAHQSIIKSAANSAIQGRNLVHAEAVGFPQWVDFGAVQSFIRIDVAYSRQKCLIKEDTLNSAFVFFQTLMQ